MQNLLALLLPRICLLCGDGAQEPFNLCPGCIRDLPRIGAFCRRCALPLSESGLDVCAQCAHTPPPFDRAIAAFRYLEPADWLIRRLKYQRDLSVAPTLGLLLWQRIALEDHEREPPVRATGAPSPSQASSARLQSEPGDCKNAGRQSGDSAETPMGATEARNRAPVPSPEHPRPPSQRARRLRRLPPAFPLPSGRHRGRCGDHRSHRRGARPGGSRPRSGKR